MYKRQQQQRSSRACFQSSFWRSWLQAWYRHGGSADHSLPTGPKHGQRPGEIGNSPTISTSREGDGTTPHQLRSSWKSGAATCPLTSHPLHRCWGQPLTSRRGTLTSRGHRLPRLHRRRLRRARVPNVTQSSGFTDEPGRNAGAPRCNPATADAGAAAP